ncbi:hypothetical protein TPHA_0A04130 [Tetrapisispora phaffii CBS 4417]|uniref:Kinase n=1 Tax=Tetrapisispora phaffii (strain ATCC 24235 / CBS 4417 / NBRC 1672 / NRRL Y-8282 / UCD 70-5) TaxID=1071381 RepID=G8BNL0_TETPH|nr:hypothetical protein TPHA_0A04130 [Tetrapisispora phaffii CBS 4417]CCE61488.1 hypothetical protein TPHA_0A04130 [Tetrapisispora phaffii CBS 4417]
MENRSQTAGNNKKDKNNSNVIAESFHLGPSTEIVKRNDNNFNMHLYPSTPNFRSNSVSKDIRKNNSSNFLKGRKASTYLRIFTEDQNSNQDETISDNQGDIYNNSDCSNNSNISVTGNILRLANRKSVTNIGTNSDNNKPFSLPKTIEFSNMDKSFDSVTESLSHIDKLRITTKSNDIGSHKIKPVDSNGLDDSCNTIFDSNRNTAAKIPLTPISSATYYPHKLQDGEEEEDEDFIGNINEEQHIVAVDKNSILNKDKIQTKNEDDKDIFKVISEDPKELQIKTYNETDSKIVDSNDKINKSNTGSDVYVNKGDKDEDEDGHEYPLAVELQPFTQTVGGHTAIFRFSKRAVCKALVNRENKWYETIELRHKDLLAFMPRYIGVLNVRQHFRSREDFLREVSRTKVTKKGKKMEKEKKFENLVNSVSSNSVAASKGEDIRTALSGTHVPSNVTNQMQLSKTMSDISENAERLEMKFKKQKEHKKQSKICQPNMWPEVLLDDNKHIIPESLWDRYANFPNPALNHKHHYPYSRPADYDAYIADSSNSTNQLAKTDPIDDDMSKQSLQKKVSHKASTSYESNEVRFSCDSGSTSVNTKLQELVLKEVFAPKQLRRNKSQPNVMHNMTSDISSAALKLTDESTTSVPRDTDQACNINQNSVSALGDQRTGVKETLSNTSNADVEFSNNSPLLNKVDQSCISTNVGSPHSVMDLEQLYKKETARVNFKNEKNASIKLALLTSHDSHENVSVVNKDKITLSTLTDKANDSDISDPNISATLVIQENTEHKVSNDCLGSKSKYNSMIDETENISFEENSGTIVSKFILLEDLTRNMKKPCALDLKMGTRQYGVDATISKQLSQTKKCLNTTSRKLGVRICGLKIWDKDYYICRDKYFGRRVKIGWQFARTIARFFYNGSQNSSILMQIPNIISQLDELLVVLKKLVGYRLYGASILLLYDGVQKDLIKNKCKVKLIDFARGVTKDDIDEGLEKFCIPPRSPGTEDRGFIRGVKSLKFYLNLIWNYLTNDAQMVFGEEELYNHVFNNPDPVLRERYFSNWDWLDDFDKENENEANDSSSALRQTWRKYELIFDVEPIYDDDENVSD